MKHEAWCPSIGLLCQQGLQVQVPLPTIACFAILPCLPHRPRPASRMVPLGKCYGWVNTGVPRADSNWMAELIQETLFVLHHLWLLFWECTLSCFCLKTRGGLYIKHHCCLLIFDLCTDLALPLQEALEESEVLTARTWHLELHAFRKDDVLLFLPLEPTISQQVFSSIGAVAGGLSTGSTVHVSRRVWNSPLF